MQFSYKVEKEGKPHGKNPPPKREKKRMHGWSNQDPPIMTYIYIQKRMMRGRETEEAPPPKRRMSTNDCSDEEADPRMQNGVPPLRKKQCPRYR